jgi:hypothetical protein
MGQLLYTLVLEVCSVPVLEGGSFHWDSPWIREQVHGEVAELEGILLSNPYGKRKTVQETAKVSIQTLIFFTL